MHTTPISLLLRLNKPGAETAWQRFVELYTPLLFYWARQAGLRSPDDEDLVQEMFALLVQKLPEFHYDHRGSFRGWLRTVLRNRLCDLTRHRPLVASSFDEAGLANIPARSADDLWEEEHRRLLVSRAAQIMRSDFQETTWRACWEMTVNERPAAEVAKLLGISENAVYVAKGRVLRRLRQELEGLL